MANAHPIPLPAGEGGAAKRRKGEGDARSTATTPSGSVDRARATCAANATEAEKRLWRALREAFPTAKFRRQVPLGRYYRGFPELRRAS